MADNQFLSGIKIDQFIKANNDQIKQTFSDAFSGIAKSVSEIIKAQKISNLKLEAIDNKLKDVSTINKTISSIYELQKNQIKLLSGKDKELSKTLNTLMSTSKKNDTAKKSPVEKKQAKDYFKRENYNEEMTDSLSGIDKGISMLIKLEQNKDKVKKGGLLGLLGLLGMAGAILAGGGLLGFILTGKKEFLYSTMKGVKYIGKGIMAGIKAAFTLPKAIKNLPKMFDGVSAVIKSFKSLGSLKGIITSLEAISKVAKDLTKTTKVLSEAAKGGKLLKTVGAGVKTAAGAGKLGKTAKSIHTLSRIKKAHGLGGVAAKLIKGGGKLTGKSLSKRIPILGSVMAVAFAFNRFKSGDIAGGFMELGSGGLGLLDIVAPGVGTALSLVADLAIMGRDMKRASGGDSGGNSGSSALTGVKAGIGGDGIGSTSKNANYAKINNRKYGKGSKGNIFTRGWGFIKNLTGRMFNGVKGASGGSGNTDATQGESVSSPAGYATSVRNLSQDKKLQKIISLNGGGGYKPDYYALKPDMRSKFESMAEEYNRITGGKMLVNSAKRSGGSSVHNFGYALDVNTVDSKGRTGYVPDKLLQKYGFHSPLKRWKSDYGGELDEPWHIEPYPGQEIYGRPRNVLPDNNDKYRYGTLARTAGGPSVWGGASAGGASPAKGDTESSTNNLPKGVIPKKVTGQDDVTINLSSSSMDTLANKIGKQIQEKTPVAKTKVVASGGASGRGL